MPVVTFTAEQTSTKTFEGRLKVPKAIVKNGPEAVTAFITENLDKAKMKKRAVKQFEDAAFKNVTIPKDLSIETPVVVESAPAEAAPVASEATAAT